MHLRKVLISAAAGALVLGIGSAAADEPLTASFDMLRTVDAEVMTSDRLAQTRGAAMETAVLVAGNMEVALANSDGQNLTGFLRALFDVPSVGGRGSLTRLV